MGDNIAIRVRNVSKEFRVPHEKYSSLKQSALNVFKPKSYSKFKSVDDISFDIKKGEFFGIVGRNGCGKSTLLKMMANIYTPSSGTININGSLSPFIELGVGFNMELSGRENVYLSGTILGMKRKEIEDKFNEIIAFAELEEFVDQKLKNYSSGMQVRLAFSIAVQAKSDIMLIDEVLAVGDSNFQKKCFAVFREMKKSGRTIVFVTHDMSNVEQFCDRVLVIRDGKSLGVVDASEANVMYGQLNIKGDEDNISHKRWGTGEVKVKEVRFIDPKTKRQKSSFQTNEDIRVKIELETHSKINRNLVIGLAFYDEEGNNISGPNSKGTIISSDDKYAFFDITSNPFNQNDYSLTVAIYDSETEEALDYIDKNYTLHITSTNNNYGKIVLNGRWGK